MDTKAIVNIIMFVLVVAFFVLSMYFLSDSVEVKVKDTNIEHCHCNCDSTCHCKNDSILANHFWRFESNK